MKDNMRFWSILTFCICAFVLTLTTTSGTAFAQCAKATDAQVVSDIYTRIKENKSLTSQVSHINVVSSSLAVKFQGWADNKNDFDAVVEIGMTTNCARVVNINNFLDAPPPTGDSLKSTGGCASGTKACGDVCIPENDVCNITGFLGFNTPQYRLDWVQGFEVFEPVSACW